MEGNLLSKSRLKRMAAQRGLQANTSVLLQLYQEEVAKLRQDPEWVARNCAEFTGSGMFHAMKIADVEDLEWIFARRNEGVPPQWVKDLRRYVEQKDGA